MNKIRVDGETISPDKTYSGKRVIALCNAAFENGVYRGRKEAERENDSISTEAWKTGYKNGYEAASADLLELQKLLRRIINVEGLN